MVAMHAQGFRTAEEVQRFSDMMDEMCYIVATKHSGSLKACPCLRACKMGGSSSPCMGGSKRRWGLLSGELWHMLIATCTLPGTPGAYVGPWNRAG